MRDVVITGVGVRTALGHSPELLFDNLIAGKSAVRHMDEWAAVPELLSWVAAPILDYNSKEIPRKLRRTMGRLATFAASASRSAADQAQLTESQLASGRVSVAVGSTMGSASAEQELWSAHLGLSPSRKQKGSLFFKVMAHTAAANVAMFLGVAGETHAVNAACASGTQAMGLGLAKIRGGLSDIVLCGGADEVHVTATVTFDNLLGASRDFNESPTQTPRPFDAARDGIVVGEGAGIAVLESAESAAMRDVPILARVLGYGASTDAVNMASPGIDGIETAMRAALHDAKLHPHQIDYVNAHATGTPIGDAAEAEAIYRVFGDKVPVSSLKGHLGHTLGACGAIELSAAIECMRRGVVPHTLNLSNPNVAPLFLPTEPLFRPCRHVMSANFAFGGVNTAVVLGSGEPSVVAGGQKT